MNIVMRSRYIRNDLLAFLQDGKLHKIADICFELEISRSTCIRHINDLSKHYNIQTFVGKHGGGVQLIPEQKVSVEKLTADDLQFIIEHLNLLQNPNASVKAFINNLTTQKDLKEIC